jgi:hypothetical protein
VLGDARKKTMPKGPPQEFVNVGKLNTSPDDDPKLLGDRTRGEFFREAQTFGVFEPGPDSPTGADEVERVATHEVAHGIFDPQLDAFMKANRLLGEGEGQAQGERAGRGPARRLRRPQRARGPGPVGHVLLRRSRAPEEGRRPRPGEGDVGQPVPEALRVHPEGRRRLD